MSVLDYVREKDPRFKDVPDDELTLYLGSRKPEFLQDPEFKQDFQTKVGMLGLKAAIGGQEALLRTLTNPAVGEAAEMGRQQTKEERQAQIQRATGVAGGGQISPIAQSSPILSSISRGPMSLIPPEEAPEGWTPPPGPGGPTQVPGAPVEGAIQTNLQMSKPPGTGEQVGRGVGESLIGLGDFMLSPLGVATLGIGALPAAIQRTVALGFATQMASQAPEIAKELGTEFGKPAGERDTTKIAKLITDAATTTGFTIGAGFKGLAPTRIPAAQIAKTAEVAPLTARALQEQVTGTALKIPEGAPPEAPGGVTAIKLPLPVSAEAAEIKPTTESKTDAIQEQKPDAEVLRDERPEVGLPQVVKGDQGTEVAPAAQESQAPTEQAKDVNLTPAIITEEGKTLTGNEHASIRAEAAKQGLNAVVGHQEGFVDQNGKFYTRAEGADIFEKQTGKKPNTPGELHSEDLKAAGLLPEKIVSAAYRDESGNVTTGPHHPAILEKLGVKGFESRESRNTPQFGFTTDTGRFVTREEAAPLAEKSGQKLTKFEGPPHSDEISATPGGETPISETAQPVETKPTEEAAVKSEEAKSKFKSTEKVKGGVPDNGRVSYRVPATGKVKRFIKWNGQWFKDKGGVTSGNPLDPEISLTAALDKQLARESQPEPSKAGNAWEMTKAEWAQQSIKQALEGETPQQLRYRLQQENSAGYRNVHDVKASVARLRKEIADAKKGIPSADSMAIHRQFVAARLASGKPIRPEVAADYPELSKPQGSPEIQGMGGAVPAEFGEGDYVSNMFAAIDKDRGERGLPPMDPGVKRTWGQDADKALSMMRKDPNWIPRLLDEVTKSPRPLLSWEQAGTVYQRANWKSELNNAYRRINRAFEDNKPEDIGQSKIFAAVMEDNLAKLDAAVGKGGTGSEAGRSLNAQKMAADDDFELVSMVMAKEAKLGRKVTDTERANLQKIADDYKAKSEDLEKQLATSQERQSQAEAARAIAEIKAQSVPTFDRRVLAHAENIVSRMERAAEPAAQRLRERLMRMSAGVDPTIVYDAAVVASARIARLGLDLAKLTDSMVRDFGEKIRDLMPDVWTKANELVEQNTKDAPEPVKRAVKKQDFNEFKKSTVETIKDKIAKNEKDKVAWYVKRLAREFVKNGIKEREPLIDAVHEVMQEAIPGITRRETMDAISGYGDYRQLSKDKISVELRGMKGEMLELAKLEDMALGKPPLKSGVERGETTEARRLLIKKVNEAKREFQVPMTDPSTQLKSSLDTLKTAIANRIKDYEDRIARKDYKTRERTPLKLDMQAFKAKAELEKVKDRYEQEKFNDRLANRAWWEKVSDAYVKWKRAFVLSSPGIFEKLFMAAQIRSVMMPTETAIGTLYGKLPGYSKIFEKAPIEGAPSNLNVEIQSKVAHWTKGLKDAYQKMTQGGKSELDVVHGKHRLGFEGESTMLEPHFLNYIAFTHGALKAPVFREAYTRALMNTEKWNAERGVDVTDPIEQLRMSGEAYQFAERQIFLQDNAIVSGYKRFLSRLNQVDPVTGKPSPGLKAMSAFIQGEIPIVKVPMNIVGETIEYLTGAVTGNVKAANALRKGIDKLPPQEAEMIARELKKGTLGLSAAILVGYLLRDQIGGFYIPGHRTKKKGVKVGEMVIGDYHVDEVDMHAPIFTAIFYGATVGKAADSKIRKSDKDQQGLLNGIVAASLGLGELTPFYRSAIDAVGIREPAQRQRIIGQRIQSQVVPGAIRWVATHTDKNEAGEPIERAPKTVMQNVEMGIPGLRQTVPRKKK